ncbi:hypothetical protein M407DRAFT_117926 [Tulasnella calospora MUT 4182]|uniref:Uncharacterized protein n=1 Tax=Tulasnella calospora MUT 4182 TaxID=1051891 RepID=A0A0C3QBG9_9AGAM|nr:hypothetical protein M407DRAFT_117926 [Tulasnella calospora MUT 4182]
MSIPAYHDSRTAIPVCRSVVSDGVAVICCLPADRVPTMRFACLPRTSKEAVNIGEISGIQGRSISPQTVRISRVPFGFRVMTDLTTRGTLSFSPERALSLATCRWESAGGLGHGPLTVFTTCKSKSQ